MRRHFLGEIGISYNDYIRMSIAQLKAVSEGYVLRKASNDDNFRTLSWIVARAFSDAKKMPNKIQDWWHLPTDDIIQEPEKHRVGKRINEEEYYEWLNKMKRGQA